MALVDKIIWQLERHLAQPLTTQQLADLCAISPYHMNRAFRAGTGQTPMGYLRRRRLSNAALALTHGSDDILTIALDAQYASHEAFTRAFTTTFGCAPRDLRRTDIIATLPLQDPIPMQNNDFLDLAAPNIEDRPALRVAGLSIPCSKDKIAEITPLWTKFNAMFFEDGLDQSAAYGVSYNVADDGTFDYMAAAQLAGDTAPKGMNTLDIPAGRYAVFEHNGHVSDMPKMFHTIWNKSMSEQGLTPRCAPEYECYDKRFDPQTGRGTMVVAIPVE